MANRAEGGKRQCGKKHALHFSNVGRDETDIICDRCNEAVRVGCYSCDPCDYDLCVKCYLAADPVGSAAASDEPPVIVFSAHGDTCFGESSCIHVPNSGGNLLYGHMDNFAGVHAMMNAYFSGALPPSRVHCKVTYGEESTSADGVEYAGAREVMKTLRPKDFVAVIDVTGTCSRTVNHATTSGAGEVVGHVVVEKVRNNKVTQALLKRVSGRHTHIGGNPVPEPVSEGSACADASASVFTRSALGPQRAPYTFETWNFCADPQAIEDESDAYRETQENTVFLGLQTCGGCWPEEEGGNGDEKQLVSNGDYNEGPVFCWRRDIDALSSLIVDLSRAFVEHYEDILEEVGEQA